MAIYIKSSNSESDLKSESECIVNYIPCLIDSNGDAKVNKYFEQFVVKDENNGVLSNSFRGHPLKGTVIDVPAGYKGMVLTESKKPLSENTEREFNITHKFKDIKFWNWDKVPTKNDAFAQALDWIDIADALHSPVEPEEK